MNLDPALYSRVRELVDQLVEFTFNEDTTDCWSLYKELQAVCEQQEKAGNAHPFFFETLADFTSGEAAIPLYDKAPMHAQCAMLPEYIASVQLPLAERHFDLGNDHKALEFASQANEIARDLEDLELRKQISEFLLRASGT
jgi:hypothetical protein